MWSVAGRLGAEVENPPASPPPFCALFPETVLLRTVSVPLLFAMPPAE